MVHTLRDNLLRKVDLTAMWLALPDPDHCETTHEEYAAAVAELEELLEPGTTLFDAAIRAAASQPAGANGANATTTPHVLAPENSPDSIPFAVLGEEQQAAIIKAEAMLQQAQAQADTAVDGPKVAPQPTMYVLSGGPCTGTSGLQTVQQRGQITPRSLADNSYE